jgi:hypothetical protein
MAPLRGDWVRLGPNSTHAKDAADATLAPGNIHERPFPGG